MKKKIDLIMYRVLILSVLRFKIKNKEDIRAKWMDGNNIQSKRSFMKVCDEMYVTSDFVGPEAKMFQYPGQ